MNILIFFASGLGDALFVGPAAFALKETYPDAKIVAGVPRLRFNRYLLENILPFDDILCLKRPKFSSLPSWATYFANTLKLASTIRKQRFDIVIPTIQARLPDQYMLTCLSGARHRIGPELWRRKKNFLSFLLTDVTRSGAFDHICSVHFDNLRVLNSDLQIDRYVSKVTESLLHSARNVELDRQSDRMVTILPGSGSQAYKRWDFKNFITTIEHILDTHKCDVAVIGGADEYDASLIPSVIRNNKLFHDINGKLDLPEIIGLLCQTDLIVGNDNGLLHLGEFLNVPTVGIYATNWRHLSGRYLGLPCEHTVLPADAEDIVAEYLLHHSLKSRRFKRMCNSVVAGISVEEVITPIDRFFGCI